MNDLKKPITSFLLKVSPTKCGYISPESKLSIAKQLVHIKTINCSLEVEINRLYKNNIGFCASKSVSDELLLLYKINTISNIQYDTAKELILLISNLDSNRLNKLSPEQFRFICQVGPLLIEILKEKD